MAQTPSRGPWRSSGGSYLRAPLIVLTVLLTFGLLSMGTRGDEIASVLSLGVVLTTLVLTISASRTAPAADASRRAATWWRRASPLKRFANVAGAIVVGAGLGWLAFYLYLGPPVEFAYQTDVEGGQVGNGAIAVVRFPDETPSNDTLGLTLVVDDVRGTGDCVRSAALELTPIVDGAPREPVRARSGEEARLGVGDERTELSVEVRPTMDDGCVVRLRVTGALFYG